MKFLTLPLNTYPFVLKIRFVFGSLIIRSHKKHYVYSYPLKSQNPFCLCGYHVNIMQKFRKTLCNRNFYFEPVHKNMNFLWSTHTRRSAGRSGWTGRKVTWYRMGRRRCAMYRIETTKTVGGEVIAVPAIETETETEARAQMDKEIEAIKSELDAPYMREIGGNAEVYLIDTGTGGGSNVVRMVTIKRPLHSPAVTVCERG